MNEITIRVEMTSQEYYAFQDAVSYGKGVRFGIWAVVYTGAAFLASSAALVWGTSASILAGLALAAFIFSFYWAGRIRAKQFRQAYTRYKEADTCYTFTSE
jgi:hypothetical protein